MATEFDDSQHFATFKGPGSIRTGNAFDVRWSEITLASLRSAGFLDNMVDGTVPPSIDLLWLDKNLDPAVLKEWDPVGSNWEPVTSQTLFGRVPWRGEWQSSAIYRRADLVSYQGSIWIAVQPGQNHVPAEDVYWDLFMTSLADASVTTDKIADDAVTEPKLAENAVTPEKVDPTRDFGDVLKTATWTSGRTQTMKDRSKRECHILDFAGPSSLSDRTVEFMNWAAQGQTAGVKLVIGSDGSGPADFIIQQEIEITKPGQVIEFDMAGGWMDHEAGIGGVAPNLRLRAAGGVSGWFNTAGKRVRSRRIFRGSAADPQDAPLSALINIQADNVHIIRPSLWLDCDYGVDLSGGLPNLGDYCDVGIFVGSRAAVQIHDPFIKGYYRRASIYIDVTYDSDGPRHLDKAGNPYPNGTPRNGADGIHIYNPRVHGGRVGIAALGALPKVGATTYGDPYYDQQLGATFADSRGTSGLSDFLIVGGDVYGPDHHSNWRLADPTLSGGTLNQTSLMAEPDNMPAAIHIDGLAGNASGNVWGHRIIGTRISSFEAFRVRLDRSSRDEFVGAHIEGRASSARKSATGVLLTTISATTTNDYTLLAYGDISGTTRTDRTTVIGSPRQSLSDGLAPHYYGSQKPLYITDSGRINIPGYALNEVGSLDLRSASGSAAILRSGTSTVLNAPAAGIASTTTAASPNVYCSGTNILQVSTSTGTLKTDVEDIDPAHRDAILSVRPVWYRSLASADNPGWSWYGLIAEEVAAIDPRLVHWQTEELVIRQVIGENGATEETEEVVPLSEPRPTGVMYDRFVPAILSKLAELSEELEALKGSRREVDE